LARRFKHNGNAASASSPSIKGSAADKNKDPADWAGPLISGKKNQLDRIKRP